MPEDAQRDEGGRTEAGSVNGPAERAQDERHLDTELVDKDGCENAA